MGFSVGWGKGEVLYMIEAFLFWKINNKSLITFITCGQSLNVLEMGENDSGDTMATGFPWSSGVNRNTLVSGGFLIKYCISFSRDGIGSGVGRFSGMLPSLLPLLRRFRALGVRFLGVAGDLHRSTMWTAGLFGWKKITRNVNATFYLIKTKRFLIYDSLSWKFYWEYSFFQSQIDLL